MASSKLVCNVESGLLEQLTLALTLNKEDLDGVMSKLISNYISESFFRAAKNISATSVPVLNTEADYGKANRKIPIWATRPNQNNHKIIKAFLQIEEEMGHVPYDILVERCSNATSYPETFVADFRGNFAQMKTDASNSHGKVFVMDGDNVEIWDEVEPVLNINRGRFINSQIEENPTKITNEMSEKAYEIAKKVYHGKISRTDAKREIAEATGMNIGSAGDYVNNLMAMLEGKRYTRTLNSYATRYFLHSIKRDFGQDIFNKALKATSEHLQYYNSLGYGNLNSIQEIIDELK